MRKLGIIGGTSWSSTALYYDHINRGVAQRLGGLHSARLAMESLDLAPVAELELSGEWDAVAKIEIDAASVSRQAAPRGSSSPPTPATNATTPWRRTSTSRCCTSAMPADKLVADGRTRVALLGTRFTMTEPHVRSRLESRGITLMPVEPDWIREVDRIIFEELAAARVVRDSQRKLKTLITELAKQKVQAVVLGCTELVLAVDVRANVLPVYDTTEIHAKAAVEWMLAEEEVARAAA